MADRSSPRLCRSPFGPGALLAWCVAAWSLAISPTALLAEASWPHYRGPHGNGVSTESGWTTRGAAVAWRAEIGKGASSFAVADGKVFTLGNHRGVDTIWAFDAASGKVVWKHQIPTSDSNRMGHYPGGPGSTPTVDGDRVYALTQEGDLVCLNIRTGAHIWSLNYPRDLGGRRPSWGFCSSPLVHGDLLILDTGSRLGSTAAVNKLTGEIVWQTGRDPAGYSAPVVFNGPRGEGIMVFKGRSLVLIDPKTGEEWWSHTWRTSHDVNASSPVLVGDGERVFLSTGYGTGSALLDAKGEAPFEVWRNRAMSNQMSTSVFHQGYLYGIDGDAGRPGQLVCLDAASGEVKWRDGRTGVGSLMIADDQLIVLTESGQLLIAPASPQGLTPSFTLDVLPARAWTMPVLADGRIFARNLNGQMVCVQLGKQ